VLHSDGDHGALGIFSLWTVGIWGRWGLREERQCVVGLMMGMLSGLSTWRGVVLLHSAPTPCLFTMMGFSWAFLGEGCMSVERLDVNIPIDVEFVIEHVRVNDLIGFNYLSPNMRCR
jgi:hypothetical protein